MRLVTKPLHMLLLLMCILGTYSYWVWASTKQRPALVIEPFANTYQLQQDTGINFGFNPNERFPGYGGRNSHVDIKFQFNGLMIECQDAIIEIVADLGLIRSGYVSCPVGESSTVDEVTAAAHALINKINASKHWLLHKNHMKDTTQSNNEGSLQDYFLATHRGGLKQPYGVVRTRLMGWRSDKHRAALDLSAVIRWRNGDSRLRYEIDFSVDNTCFQAISSYEGASAKGKLNQPEYQKIQPLRDYFSHRIYKDIPWEERVELTHRYVTELCENKAKW